MEQGTDLALRDNVLSAPELCSVWPPTRSNAYWFAKRLLDFGVASSVLFFLWPLMVIIALAIRFTEGSPIIFRQRRVGRDGREFILFKYRSLVIGPWDVEHQHVVRQQMFAVQSRRKQKRFFEGPDRRKSDFKCVPLERMTAIGRLLRKTGLDELPQLWNVLKGDMSLVGPRPPIPYELHYRSDEQRRRLAIPPGLTGLWQASGWSQLNYAEMIQVDLDYIERQSFWLDVQILLKTPLAILTSWRR